MCVVGPDLRTRFVSVVLAEMLGYPAEEMLGRPLRDLITEDLWPSVEAAATGRSRDDPGLLPVVFRHRDGSRIEAVVVCTPMFGAEDEFLGAIGTISDVRVIAAAEIAAQQMITAKLDLLENMLDHIPIMVAKFSPEGTPLYFNDELERKLGWTLEEAASDPQFLEKIHPDREMSEEAFATLRRADGKWVQLQQRTRDGSLLRTSCVVTRLADGSVLGIAEDITERVKLEEQLLQSQRLDSVGRLAGGVAHDFNNLLTVIIGYGEMLDGTIGPMHPARSMLSEIRHSADRARDLTAQLLAFARRQVIRPRQIELDELVRGTERILRRLIDELIEISLDLASAGHSVRVDPGQMEQVLLNLALNSRDAMPRGGKLTIETAYVTLSELYAQQHDDVRSGPHIVLVVSDTGEGMSGETLSHIFEPFFTTKAPGRGTGLGLATVYGIVKQSGGHIFVYSEPATGTTFKVYLPVAAGGVEEPMVEAGPRQASLVGHERVWVVEDEPHVRTLTARILREAGYEVSEAEGPTQALELAAGLEFGPDVLLTDVVMPGMSGRDLADRLHEKWPATRVLYVSGYTHNTIVHHGVLESGVEFLGKPFTPSQLLARVREVLGSGVVP